MPLSYFRATKMAVRLNPHEASKATIAVLIEKNKQNLKEINSGLGRVPARTIFAQSKPKGSIAIFSCVGEVPTWAIPAQSIKKSPIEIYTSSREVHTSAISTNLNPKGPFEMYSGLGEVRSRMISAQLNQERSTEVNCILQKNPFYRNCIFANKKSFSGTVAPGSCMFYQARAISIVPQKAFVMASNLPPEYQMPTVTWGAVQGLKEKLASQSMIFDYLRSLGIVPDELEEVELPSTVDIMKERVEFLQGMGLNIKDINEYPLMLGCSVRKNLIPVLDFLYRFGIEKPDLPVLLRRYPRLLHASVVVELVPIIKYLRGLDIEKTDIPIVLRKYPEVLGFKLEGTMSTSVAYLVNIGVSPRDIGPMLTEYPQILGMRVGTIIKPFVDYLMSLGFPKQIITRMIEKRPHILGYDLDETIKPNVEHIISVGVRQEALASVIAQYPQILGLSLKPKLDSLQQFFKSNAKVGPEDFGRLLEKMPQVVILRPAELVKPVYFLKGRGFAVEDVTKMVVACPQLLVLDVESMKLSFYYYKTEIKRCLQELVEFPDYFTYSLEWRIKPRFRTISSKGIKCSLPWFLNCSDKKFEERLEDLDIEIDERGPSFSMGGALQLPGDGNDSAGEFEDSEEEMSYISTGSVNKK
ncbi:transcription termination factor MTERF4, chloroplastic isoform X2 [Cryptomeria japonica]|uniref:transcription termination factor MTERF4, chloroplastic isoform X2 n=1 Tax=Cryptomeria japonica TaxID=3369 RepID=UPI0027D9E3A4|nr:transcription termination factor MTERF4, chloroplastic isoform X2 [Cryptomeria japonica]